MATFSQTVYVDVELDEFDENEIVEHLEYQGYTVTKNPAAELDFTDVEWYVQRDNLKEALILLERKLPELKGISKLTNM